MSKLEELIVALPDFLLFEGKIYRWRIKKVGRHYRINYIGKRERPKAPYPILISAHDSKITKAIEKMIEYLKTNKHI